jgi:DNA-binding NarL/FixJ family response regulator
MMGKSVKVQREINVDAESLKIVSYLSSGWSVAAISVTTGIEVRTLENKIASMRKTFGCGNTPNLVAFFLRNKLIK